MTTHPLHLPSLGEGVASAAVARILVKTGERVAAGQPLLEVETDKVTVEVPADVAGIVEAIHCAVGDEIAAGAVYATLREVEEEAATAPPEELSLIHI